MNVSAYTPSKVAVSHAWPGVLVLTAGCFLRGGAVATYRPKGSVVVEGTATAAFGGRGATGPGAALGATLSAGYDARLDALTGTIGPSFEYFSPGGDWTFAALGSCGGRLYDERVEGSVLGAVACELRAGPLHILSYDGKGTARWAGAQAVVRFAFAGTSPEAEGWSFGIAGTWENWFTYVAPVNGRR